MKTSSLFESDISLVSEFDQTSIDFIHEAKRIANQEHFNCSIKRALIEYLVDLGQQLPEAIKGEYENRLEEVNLPKIPSNVEIEKAQDISHAIVSDYLPKVFDISQPDVFQLTVNQVGAYKFLEQDWSVYCQEPILAELMPHIDVHKCTIREDGSLAFNYLKFNNGEEFSFERHDHPYLNGLSISETSIGIAYQLFKQIFDTSEAA
ncbi:MAG: hypothetical protein JKY00_06855 [Roseicyclus sp.]|nr:hypothetical protein [Roseicyclus sp.]